MYDSITCNDVAKPMQTHPGKDQPSAYPYPRGQIAHRVSYDDSIQKQDRIVKGNTYGYLNLIRQFSIGNFTQLSTFSV